MQEPISASRAHGLRVAEAGSVPGSTADLWPLYPSMDAPTRLQEPITKLHCLLLEPATSGEIENRGFVAILKFHS